MSSDEVIAVEVDKVRHVSGKDDEQNDVTAGTGGVDNLNILYQPLDHATHSTIQSSTNFDFTSRHSPEEPSFSALMRDENSSTSAISANDNAESSSNENNGNKSRETMAYRNSDAKSSSTFDLASVIPRVHEWRELQVARSNTNCSQSSDLKHTNSGNCTLTTSVTSSLESDRDRKMQRYYRSSYKSLTTSSEVDTTTTTGENSSGNRVMSTPSYKIVADKSTDTRSLLHQQRRSYIRRLQREIRWLEKVEKSLMDTQFQRDKTAKACQNCNNVNNIRPNSSQSDRRFRVEIGEVPKSWKGSPKRRKENIQLSYQHIDDESEKDSDGDNLLNQYRKYMAEKNMERRPRVHYLRQSVVDREEKPTANHEWPRRLTDEEENIQHHVCCFGRRNMGDIGDNSFPEPQRRLERKLPERGFVSILSSPERKDESRLPKPTWKKPQTSFRPRAVEQERPMSALPTTASFPRVENEVPHRHLRFKKPVKRKGVAWFVPLGETKPWLQARGPGDGSHSNATQSTAFNIDQQEDDGESRLKPLERLTLQESIRYFKSNFILKSEARQQKLSVAARNRRHTAQLNYIFLTGNRQQIATVPDPHSDMLHRPQRRTFTHREMRDQTERLYRGLPEVIGQAEAKHKKDAFRTNRLMAQIFKSKIQKKALKGEVSYPLTTVVQPGIWY